MSRSSGRINEDGRLCEIGPALSSSQRRSLESKVGFLTADEESVSPASWSKEVKEMRTTIRRMCGPSISTVLNISQKSASFYKLSLKDVPLI